MTKQILVHVRAMLILMASRWLSYSFRQNAAAGMSYNNTRTNHQRLSSQRKVALQRRCCSTKCLNCNTCQEKLKLYLAVIVAVLIIEFSFIYINCISGGHYATILLIYYPFKTDITTKLIAV